MAKIEFISEASENAQGSLECLEVLVWGAGGQAGQEFVIGGGSNFNASTNYWLEIRYSVQGLPVFYTRNIVSHAWDDVCSGQLERLARFENDEFPGFGFGDMLPETGLHLKRNKVTHTNGYGGEDIYISYSLVVSVDMGAVFGQTAPGVRMFDLRIEDIELEDGLRFMRDLIGDLEAACQGRHPDPGLLPPGFSDWPFARDLNRKAYDQVAVEYQEDYFENPLLAEAFDAWLGQLPAGGSLLDAGCGHGDPVISRLLERGFQVTGSDISPVMLARARAQFPQVEFWPLAMTEISAEATFDGICSFSSMLYLDPIDFFHALYRLYRALKPGATLFLYGFDLHPGWRGQPYDMTLNQWMWGGNRGLDETLRALEEHGYFRVTHTQVALSEAEQQERITAWRARAQKQHDEWLASLPPNANITRTDYSTVLPSLSYPYVVIAQKQSR